MISRAHHVRHRRRHLLNLSHELIALATGLLAHIVSNITHMYDRIVQAGRRVGLQPAQRVRPLDAHVAVDRQTNGGPARRGAGAKPEACGPCGQRRRTAATVHVLGGRLQAGQVDAVNVLDARHIVATIHTRERERRAKRFVTIVGRGGLELDNGVLGVVHGGPGDDDVEGVV